MIQAPSGVPVFSVCGFRLWWHTPQRTIFEMAAARITAALAVLGLATATPMFPENTKGGKRCVLGPRQTPPSPLTPHPSLFLAPSFILNSSLRQVGPPRGGVKHVR